MRKPVTFGVIVAVAVVAALALLDAVVRDPGDETRDASTVTDSRPTTTVLPPPFTVPERVPSWEGVFRRKIRLERPIGFAWDEFGRFPSGAHTLRVRVDLPSAAEVGIWFESVAGARIDVFGYEDRNDDPDCVRQARRDKCVRSLALRDVEAGVWRLVVRKLSSGRAVVRLTVAVSGGTGGSQ
jgi:hypothetical protein